MGDEGSHLAGARGRWGKGEKVLQKSVLVKRTNAGV